MDFVHFYKLIKDKIMRLAGQGQGRTRSLSKSGYCSTLEMIASFVAMAPIKITSITWSNHSSHIIPLVPLQIQKLICCVLTFSCPFGWCRFSVSSTSDDLNNREIFKMSLSLGNVNTRANKNYQYDLLPINRSGNYLIIEVLRQDFFIQLINVFLHYQFPKSNLYFRGKMLALQLNSS